MRILMVGPGLLPIPPGGWGAIEEVVWQLARQLRAMGHEVGILNEPDLGLVPLPAGYDVVHCHWARHALHLIRHGVCYVYTSHSHLWSSSGEQRAIKGARLHLALHQRMIGPGQRGVVIGNGVDCEFFVPDYAAKRGDTLLCIGGEQRRKRIDRAIEVAERLPHTRLVVVGPEADDTPQLKERTRDKKVLWVGKVDKEEMRRWYQAADVFLFTSDAEAFALVPLEAMACGTPVVASPEHGNDYAGVYVADGVEEMARLTQDMLNMGRSLGQNARLVAEMHYGWSRVAERVVGAYEEAIR